MASDENEPEEDFKDLAGYPFAWQIWARQLVTAANILRRNVEWVNRSKGSQEGVFEVDSGAITTTVPMALLYGLAIENMAKGALIARGNVEATQKTRGRIELNDSIKHHDLVRLFRSAEVTVSVDDERVLRRLQGVVTSGKYPIATRPQQSERHLTLAEVPAIGRMLEMLEDVIRDLAQSPIPGALEKTKLLDLGLPSDEA